MPVEPAELGHRRRQQPLPLLTQPEIRRARLAEPIAAALAAGRAVLLEADTGFGKSVVLREALEGRTVAWVAADEHDRDPGRLLRRVVRCAGAAVPGVADEAERLLGGAVERVDPRAAAAALRDGLRTLLVDPLAIVIDDAERLEGEDDAIAIVADLVGAAGGPVGVAVAGRRLPGPERLAAAVAATPPLRLGPADLAFTPGECAALLETHLGRSPAGDEVGAVMDATEGWPLGVALAAAVSVGSSVIAPASRDAALAYLDEQLLGSLEREVIDALVDSSIATVIDDVVIDALALPREIVRARCPAGLFMRPAGDGAVAHHPLAREVLAARLERERPAGAVRKLHARLAQALADAGRLDEAIEHWLTAGVWEAAVPSIAVAGAQVVSSAPATVARWIGALPEERRSDPPLAVLSSRVALGEGATERAEQHAREALAGFAARGDEAGAWMARFALADALFSHGRREQLAEVATLADALDLPAGRLDRALGNVLTAIAEVERTDDPFGRLVYLLGFLCVIHEERGEDEAAIAAARRAEVRAFERGLGEYLGRSARAFVAGVHARSGRIATAELELERACSAARPWRGWRSYDLDLTEAAIAVGRGDAAGTLAACERALMAAAGDPYPELVRATALAVPALVDAGQPARAQRALDAALERREPGFSVARLLALRAWLRRGEACAGAWDDLHAAWDEAGDQVHHLLRREWPRLRTLLSDALDAGVLDAEAVVAAVEAARPGGAALLPLLEHRAPAVRRAAALPAATSGHPAALTRLEELASDPDPDVAAAAAAAAAGVRETPPPLAIRVLGGFELRRGAWVADDAAWGRKAAERLVRFLLVHREASVPEDAIFESFWPGRPVSSARRSLQVALSCARAVLDPPGAAASVIDGAERTYRLLLRERDSVDADHFEAAARAALAESGRERMPLLRRADALWHGDPLPENAYDDWAVGWRERLLDLRAELLGALAEACEAAGDRVGTIDAARRLVDEDPLNEAGHRALIRAYARGGRRGPALRQFLECRRRLVDDLGIEPSAETAELQRRILAGEPV